MRELVIPLATGLAIFLFGMQVLRLGLERLAGARLEMWINRMTQTASLSFMTGLLVTMILQSSSVVTILAIGFVNAGLMPLSRCIGLILGTNVGTCITTELLVLPIENYAVFILLAGTIGWLLPWKRLRLMGLAIGGLGCIFLGMETMASIAGSLQHIGFIEWFFASDSIGWGVVSGMLLAALIQSSSATVALTMSLYNAQAITLTFSLAAVLGSNVGTCITAWIAAIGGNRAGTQVAMAHLLINVAGLVVFYPFVPWLSEWIATTDLTHYAQIAHFQTGFNLASSLALLPFCHRIARIVQFILPVSPS